jgi:hypothetical protein
MIFWDQNFLNLKDAEKILNGINESKKLWNSTKKDEIIV